jgi:nucleotide-binding universal stress UspA family protein
MGYRAWDHLWNLAKVVPQVSEATRAVNLTTAIRIGEQSRRPAPGGTRTLIMSPVDIKNAKINFGLEAFKAEMVRYQQQPSRIAEVDTDSDTSEFVPMSQTLDAVSSQQAPDSNSGPLASASQQPADSDRQPVSSQRSLGSEPVLPQQPNPTEQMMQKGDADKAAIGAGRRGRKRKFNAGPSSERVLRKRVRGG